MPATVKKPVTVSVKKQPTKTPEVRSALVRVAHSISSRNSTTQLVKIGDRYFRVKELG